MTSSAILLPCQSSFSLKETLIGGQCFRWKPHLDGFCGISGSRGAYLRQKDDCVAVEGDASPDADRYWRHYLDLDVDYDSIRESALALEPRLREAAARGGGIHILNQQPWEALCSFVISQNNNISRIRSLVEKLCSLCGEAVDGFGCAFPEPAAVAELSEERLAALGFGYRAGYVMEAARSVVSGRFDVDFLKNSPIAEARAALQAIRGVGPKVADCVLLYGLHRLDAFPRDVWIKRALEGEFRGTALEDFPFAGVAQQYIFEYIRTKRQPE